MILTYINTYCICITSPHTVESGSVLLGTMAVEHELTVTVVVIMSEDIHVVAIGADDVHKILKTNGVKTISQSYIFVTWIVSYMYTYIIVTYTGEYMYIYTVHMQSTKMYNSAKCRSYHSHFENWY